MKEPFLKSINHTDKMMMKLLLALTPIVLFTFYKNGVIPYINGTTNIFGMFYPLIFIFIAMLSTFIFETLYCKIVKNNNRQYSIIPGLFIALVLPINTPISILIFGCFIGIIVGKMLYGGFGNNIFNPALIGCLFVIAAYSGVIAANGGYMNSYEIDAISSATPLSNTVEGIGTYETLVTPYGTLTNFFVGTIPGSVGETSALLCLIALIYLGINKVIKYKIPVFYLSTVFIITLIIGLYNGLGLWYPLFQILSGGLMFGAIFMATDPVTSPTTSLGQIVYGICLGVLTVVFRYLTSYPEGVLTSILVMNMFVFILDKIGIRSGNYIKRSVVTISIILLLIIPITLKISNSYKQINSDPDFDLISKDINKDVTTYVAAQKGFKGKIKVEVVIKDNKVIGFNILECNDDYISIVENDNFIDRLINSDELESVDTVSGATRTSTGLKKLLINVMKDYNGEK